MPTYHGTNRYSSLSAVNFQSNSQQSLITTTTASTTTVTKVPGNYSGSFTAPGYSITWFDTTTYTDFTFLASSITSASTNIYIAMGLSSDDQMVMMI